MTTRTLPADAVKDEARLDKIAGRWQDDRNSDEILADIYEARTQSDLLHKETLKRFSMPNKKTAKAIKEARCGDFTGELDPSSKENLKALIMAL